MSNFEGVWHCYFSDGVYNGTANINITNGTVKYSVDLKYKGTCAILSYTGYNSVINLLNGGISKSTGVIGEAEGGIIRWMNGDVWVRNKRL